MKALTWQGTGKVSVEEVPDPRIEAPTDAIVRIGKEPSPDDDGNVFAPQPDLDAVRGGWRNRPARAAVGLGAAAAIAGAATAVRRAICVGG